MTPKIPLQPGTEIRCPNCVRWHAAIWEPSEGTPYTQEMMFFECRGGRYYAGQRGGTGRHPSRHPKGYHPPVPGPFRIVQPWGPRKGTDASFISEHATVVEAFAEIDRLSAQMVRTGAPSDAVELLVVDRNGVVLARPSPQ